MEAELIPEDGPLVLPPKYWAFISYSHRDEKWASWLHKRIETYTEHKKLVGTKNRYGEPVPARLFPVFRDRDELEGAPDLPERIQDALRLSRFLIVICSPHSAKSKWVNEEIKAFKTLGRQDRILAIIAGGEPYALTDEEECFPHALKFRLGTYGAFTDERTEPLAADARKQGDGERGALLKLLAAILGVRFDELKQRDLERQRRYWLRVGIATTAGFLVLLGLTVFAFKQRNEALRQRDVAELRAREALSRQLAQSAEPVITKQLDRGLLLAAHAAQLSPTFEARRVLRLALGKMPRLERFLASSGASVSAVAVDAAGKYAAIGRDNGDLAVFELETGATVPGASMRLPHAVLRLAFTADEPLSLLAVTGDAELRSLRAGPRARGFDLRLGRESLRDAAFSQDGKRLATLDESQRLVIWDVEKWPPAKSRALDLPEDVRPPLHVLAGSNTVTLFTQDAAVITAEVDTGQVTKRALKVAGPEPLAISPDGQEVAIGSRDGSNQTFTVQHLETGQRAFSSSWDELFFVTFSADASQIATTHADGVVKIRSRSGAAHNIRLPATYVSAGAFDSGGRRLITGGDSGAVAVWRVESPARAADHITENICRPDMGPRSVTLSRTSDRIVVACAEGAVNVADVSRTNQSPRRFQLPGAARVKELLALEKYRVLALLHDGRLAVFDVRDPSKTESTISFIKGVRSATALSRNGQTVGMMSRDGEVLTWKAGQAVNSPARLRLPPGEWNVFAIGPDGAEVVVGSPQGLLMHLHARANRLTPVASGSAKFVSLSISPDGKSLAAVDERARAMVRTLNTAGAKLRAIEGVRASWVDDKGPLVSAEAGILARLVEYTPDGRYLALATDEGVLLLDPATLRRLGEPLSHSAGRRPPFSFDGIGSRMARVFRTGFQTTSLGIEIEDLDWTSWIRAACRKANRELSESEIQIYLGGVRPTATCAQALRANGAS